MSLPSTPHIRRLPAPVIAPPTPALHPSLGPFVPTLPPIALTTSHPWSRVSGTGGWSARGCEVVFRNESHVSCQCNHMTSFAVLMDVSRREVSQAFTPTMVTVLGKVGARIEHSGSALLHASPYRMGRYCR